VPDTETSSPFLGQIGISRDLACLFGARAIRSLAQGYVVIILPIYLADIGVSASRMGVLFGVCALVNAGLAASVGVMADRFGRKPFLIGISLMMTVGAALFALTRSFPVMVAAAAFGTFGYGGGVGVGGGWGPYYPAAQSLVAEQIADHSRTHAFGLLSFFGVVASAAGSMLAALPAFLARHRGVPILESYRGLFMFAALAGLGMALVVTPVREERPPRRAPLPVARAKSQTPRARRFLGLSRPSWRLVSRFMLTNSVNGLAVGMLGPFVVYWFYRRFGVGASALAHLFFLINLAAAIPYLMAGRMTRWLGLVSAVAGTRAISCILLIGMVLMPTYALAAALYAMRVIVNVLSIPMRQSYLMGVIDPAERATAAGLANLPMQGTQALSASLAGVLMDHFALALPLVAASALQAVNALLFWIFFRSVRPPEEQYRAFERAARPSAD
jgi:MFS family permease